MAEGSNSAPLRPHEVTMDVLRATGNPDVRFQHCLPAFHGLSTEVGREIHARHGLSSLEVTDEAETRLHTIKALMVAGCAARRPGPGPPSRPPPRSPALS
jgi:ornithine carbamoyltransferase